MSVREAMSDNLCRRTVFPETACTACLKTARVTGGRVWMPAVWRVREAQFHTVATSEELLAKAAKSVCEDANGVVWIGRLSGGLDRWQDGVCTNLTAPDGTASGSIFCLCVGCPGAVVGRCRQRRPVCAHWSGIQTGVTGASWGEGHSDGPQWPDLGGNHERALLCRRGAAG